MHPRTVRLLNRSGATVNSASVVDDGTHFGGTIDLTATPTELRALFAEFEEVVDGQMFAFLDDVQARIAAAVRRAEFADGVQGDVWDVQVFPAAAEVSFRFAADPPGCVNGAAGLVLRAPMTAAGTGR